MTVAVMFVGVVAVATPASAADCTITKTLKMGAKGAEVKCLQALVGVKADGSFGKGTKAAVIAWQKSAGLTADGVVGAKSRAALMGGTVTTTTGYPAGCTSSAGYSSTTGQPCSTGSMTQTGPVQAMLSTDTPASGYIVGNQATADLLHVTFTGSGVVNQVVLQRTGISDQNTLNNVYLYDGMTRLTDGYSFNNVGQLTMNNLNLAVSGSRTISVKADVASSATASSLGITLVSYTPMSGTSTVVNIKGNEMTYGSGNLASAYMATQASVAVPSANVNAGTSAYQVWSAPVQVNTRAIWLKGANFRIVGSAPIDALANVQLFVDGVNAGANATMGTITGSNYAMFNFAASPVSLTTGTHTLSVRADIVKGSSYTVQVSLQQAADLVLFDGQVGVNIAAAVNGSTPFTPNNAGTITILAGSASVVIDPTFSAMTNITGGATNAVIGKFKVHGYGEDVKVSSLSVTPVLGSMTPAASGLNNLTVYFNGSQVGSSQNWTSGAATFNLGSQMILPAGTDSSIEVRADIQTTGSVSYTAGTVAATLNVGTSNGQGQTSKTTLNFPTASVVGTTLTVQTGLLAVSANAGYLSQNANPNTAGVKIGSFSLQNQSSSESINVTGLNVALAFAAPTYQSGTVTAGSQSITFNSTTGLTVGNVISIPGATPAVGTVTSITNSTVAVVNITSGGVTPTVGGAVTGSGATTGPATLTNFSNLRTSETSGSGANPVQPTASNTFSVNFNLAPGVTKVIDVFADTSTANMGAVTGTLTVTSLGGNSHVSITQTGAGTGQTITLASGAVTNPPTLVSSSSTTAQFVPAANGGATNATKAVFNFASTGGASTITELKFTVSGSTAGASATVNGVTAPFVSGVAYLTGLNLVVPLGGSGLNQDVFISYPEVGASGLASGTTSAVSLTYVKYTSGGITATFSPSVAAPTMVLVGSRPTVTAVKPTATLSASTVEAIDVTVAADAKGNITLNSLPIVVAMNAATVTAAATNNVTVKDSNNQTLAGANTAFGATSGGSSTFTFTTPYVIQAGQSQTFKIYVTVATVTGTGVNGASMSTSLGTGAGFSWTDTAGGASSPQTGVTNLPSYPSTFTSVIYN